MMSLDLKPLNDSCWVGHSSRIGVHGGVGVKWVPHKHEGFVSGTLLIEKLNKPNHFWWKKTNCMCDLVPTRCRVTGQVTPTGTQLCEKSPGTRATWRSPPRSQRLCSRRTWTEVPHGCPSSSCSSGSRGRRRAGSTRPTATPRSAWRAERSATTAGQPRWGYVAVKSSV